ncbi:MAG TPA: hypothetical protein VNS49_21095 [Streptomyces sp.]|nr:hypothetical protein [Streptomyces sp.]
MATPSLCITDAPAAEDPAVISRALGEFNVHETEADDERELAVLVKDSETDRVLGGLSGRTSLGLLFVDSFHLPAAAGLWSRQEGPEGGGG